MAAPAIGYALILRLKLPATASAVGNLAFGIGDAVARFFATAAMESSSSRRAPALAEGEESTATV